MTYPQVESGYLWRFKRSFGPTTMLLDENAGRGTQVKPRHDEQIDGGAPCTGESDCGSSPISTNNGTLQWPWSQLNPLHGQPSPSQQPPDNSGNLQNVCRLGAGPDEDTSLPCCWCLRVCLDDAPFVAKHILAEAMDRDDGIMRYLVEWRDHGLACCSWETSERFRRALLDAWEARKCSAASGGDPLFEVDDFIDAFERAVEEAEKAFRQQGFDETRGKQVSVALRLS